MRNEISEPGKKVALWITIILGGLATAIISFISITSVWIGFTHIHRSGSLTPIAAGSLVFGLTLWLYVRATRAIHSRLTSEEAFLDL